MTLTPSRIIGGFVLSFSITVAPVVFADYYAEDALARGIGLLVIAGVYLAAMMVVVFTPLYWLVIAEDRWKWLRETEQEKAARLRRGSRSYVTRQDLAEPSVRGGDWNNDYDADGGGGD